MPGTGADGALVPFAQEPTDGCLILSCGESRAGGGTSGRRAGEASSVHRRARATHPPPFRGAQAGGDGTRGALKQTVACRGGARTGRPARHVPKSCVLRSSSQKRSRERPTEPPGKPRNRLCFHLFLPFPGSAEAAPAKEGPGENSPRPSSAPQGSPLCWAATANIRVARVVLPSSPPALSPVLRTITVVISVPQGAY